MTVVVLSSVGLLLLLILTRLSKIRVPGKRLDLIAVAAACLICVMLLAIPTVYVTTDHLLGGRNIANLVSHLLLYVVFWIVGVQVASALVLTRARSLIVGPVNRTATAAVTGATIWLFFASFLPTSSMGILEYQDQWTVQAYLVLGRLYPAIISGLLVVPRSWKTALSVPLPLLRASSLLTLWGLTLVVPSPIFEAMKPYVMWAATAEDVCAYGGAALVAVGSALTWLSRRAENRPDETVFRG
ncbi:hypothetical protein IV498_14650 [Paenarthrobacter sp. Z7-10]|uniref:hypothetical protein n=1 Tax=Paenarthrobacter sp. Z7-10 TaxID=2787635 RepID=UPI0022A956D0|nr:hypothetical protein [Paenarthrobacter sp. Z7-10]MCZ2404382.1 hypothetical protein [Paenarthrobacter sp. Z7-10]